MKWVSNYIKIDDNIGFALYFKFDHLPVPPLHLCRRELNRNSMLVLNSAAPTTVQLTPISVVPPLFLYQPFPPLALGFLGVFLERMWLVYKEYFWNFSTQLTLYVVHSHTHTFIYLNVDIFYIRSNKWEAVNEVFMVSIFPLTVWRNQTTTW